MTIVLTGRASRASAANVATSRPARPAFAEGLASRTGATPRAIAAPEAAAARPFPARHVTGRDPGGSWEDRCSSRFSGLR